MALATDANPTALDSSTASATGGSGLGSAVAGVRGVLQSVVSALDPDRLLGADAASLYAELCSVERLVVAGKTLLAPRIAESGHWRHEGHRSPASLLAQLEGVSAGQARRTIETGERLSLLPSTEEALRKGRLSGPKVAEIADAATLDPTAESSLLAAVEEEPLQAVKERCQRVRATSAEKDPVATLVRIHAARHFTSFTDAEGAFCYQGRDTAERGALLLSRLEPATNRLWEAQREAAREKGRTNDPAGAGAPDSPESHAALRADALFALLVGEEGGVPSPQSPEGTAQSAEGAGTIVDRPVPHSVTVRVDLGALRRGRALPGEVCELDGQGPIPVPTAKDLMGDSFLAYLFTEAGDIRAVAHFGRTINRALRTALSFRDRHCVVPGCRVAYGLEIDHVVPLSEGGSTTLDNLALLCHHHHFQKTYEGWELARTGPTDEQPGWVFSPQPPFGREPGLGMDAPARPPPQG